MSEGTTDPRVMLRRLHEVGHQTVTAHSVRSEVSAAVFAHHHRTAAARGAESAYHRAGRTTR